MRSGFSNLAYGIHLGATELRKEVAGFSVSILQPTVHAEDVPLHTHDTASLVFVMHGRYITSADGPRQSESSPLLIFNPAGTTHVDSFATPHGRFLAVSVCDEVMTVANNGGDVSNTATAFLCGEPIAAARRVVHGSLADNGHDPSTLENLCWELVAAAAGNPAWKVSPGTSSPSWLSRARELLNDCSHGALPITRIASELDLHPVYFARRFRTYFRCSPAEYRTRCRLRQAMHLLCKTDHSLADIALATGFFDQSHFTTAFRGHFGHSPGIYRKQLEAATSRPHKVAFFQ